MISGHRTFRLIASTYLLFALVAQDARPQAGPILIRVGKWLGKQALDYATGRVFDRLLGVDYESQLKTVESNLLSQIQNRSGDSASLKTELDATRSQLGILRSLLDSRPTIQQVEQFRVRLTRDLAAVVQAQAEQGKRLKILESSSTDHEARIRRLEESQEQQKNRVQGPEPDAHLPPETPRWHRDTSRTGEADGPWDRPRRLGRARQASGGGVTLILTVTGKSNEIAVTETSDFQDAEVGFFEIEGIDRRYSLSLLVGTGGVLTIQGDANSVVLPKSLCNRVRVLLRGRDNKVTGCV